MHLIFMAENEGHIDDQQKALKRNTNESVAGTKYLLFTILLLINEKLDTNQCISKPTDKMQWASAATNARRSNR